MRDVLLREGEAIYMAVVWQQSVERCVGKRRGSNIYVSIVAAKR